MNFFQRLFGRKPRLGPPPLEAAPTVEAAPIDPKPPSRLLIGPPDSAAPIVVMPMGEGTALIDRMAYEYQAGLTPGPVPSQTDLAEALATVDRVRILAGGMMRDRALGTEVLLDSRSRTEIDALRSALAISDDPATFHHCACLGGPTIEFFANHVPEPVATLSLHHGHGLRWSRWRHDAKLLAPAALAAWLSRHELAADAAPDPNDPMDLHLLGLTDAERLARRAESHSRRGEARQALDDCDRALTLDPTAAQARGLRGLIHREAGRFPEAEADCSEAIALGLAHPEVFLARAVARDALGRPEEALADCDAALKLAPQHAAGYNSRALIRNRIGRSVEALADFAKAMQLDPDWPLPPANRGMTHLNAGRFDRAVADLTEAIRRVERLGLPDPALWRGGPDVSIAAFYALRARAHEALGAIDPALDDYTRAAELDPDDPRVYLSRGEFHLRAGEPDAAVADFTEAVRLRPDLAIGYVERGRARLMTGELDDALDDFSEAVRWAPDEPAAYSYRAQIARARGDLDDALRDLDRVVVLAPDNPIGFLERSACWAARGDHERHRADLETAIGLAPDWPLACNSLAWLLATCPDPRWRDGPRALELARHAERVLPEIQAEVLDTLAAALAECGDFTQARSYERQALDLLDNPDRRPFYEQRLALYEAELPWRETDPP